jgi:two-component system, cell cycle response regulator
MRMKILVADDDRTTRVLLSRTLTAWGYEVTAVDNGLDALERVRSGDHRVVLSDWEMPGLHGPELCAKVRALEGPYVYVMLLTSHGTSSHVVEGLESGADDYVSKPFDPPVLRARLTVARRHLALQDELASKNAELARANNDLARANSELARIATTDPLLDIGNRRSFEDVIVHAHNTARRTGRGYGVMLADIDLFKRFNDRHGHPFGDHVLRRVAQTLKESLGSAGELFRYGGEELISVVPDQTATSLPALAERMRACVESMPIEMPGGGLASVTVSIGAALFDPDDAISCQVVIDYADASLYQAKGRGRNRVICWPFAEAKAPRTSQF